ncbi:M23 family metallopeptidase [Nocardia iowensis]|uniref:M23 family metallopeptidase n=1 Tax=Nocardia iowensis TaxID=204891 RepID=A0ABX8RMM0_NOCIO|nr:M23 family metallopeptidase [Nocardia iowensis]QXN90878.1 M23 family metallopeptidase [Nocardia iowensis]
MNHRSALIPENRARSGHRYRNDDDALGAQASYGRPAGPSVDRQRNSLYNTPPADYNPAPRTDYADAAPQGDYFHAAGDARQADGYYGPANSWTANESWSQQDSWAPQDSWSQQSSWSDGAAWNAGDAWADEQYRTPENEYRAPEDGCWAPEESWASDAESDTPATPTVIPGHSATKPSAVKRGGAHRLPAPPAALKGRAAVAAVAAGAVVAAGQAALASPDQPAQSVDYQAAGQIHEIAAQSVSLADPNASPESPQLLNVSGPTHLGDFNDILQKGQKYAQDLAEAEAAKLRPLFAKFAAGNFTSGFGARWGVQHLGIDIAGPIGTPIVAVADGTVIEAGPAAGFGMWVRLLHDDGTVTVYGHIDTATVSQGQRVMAGDQIATIGNRGFSTGPHCHFEVWLNGSDKIDPVPWLATRGISLGPQRD